MSSSYKKTVAYAPAITEKTQFAPLGKIDLTDTVNASASNIVVYGRSVAINQLIDFSLVRDYVNQTYPAHIVSGIDIRAYDIDPVSQLSNCVVLNGTASADVEILLLSSETQFNRIPGHYYFLTGNNNSEASDSCYMVLGNEEDSDVLIDRGNPGDSGIHDGQIKAYEESGNVQSLYIKVLSGTTLNEVVFRPQLIDLTQLFGYDQSGSPYGALSYGEIRSLISSDYYSYNPGKIVGVESITIKSTADVGGETSSVQATISTVNGIGLYPISNISDVNNGLFDVLDLKNKQHTKAVDSVNVGGDSFSEITIDIDTYFQSSSSAADAEDGSYCLSSDGTECIVQGGKFCFKASSNIYPSLNQWNEHVTRLSWASCPLTVVYKKATPETVSVQNGLPTIKTYRGGTTVSIYTNDFSNPDAGYLYAGQDGGIAFNITYPLQESGSSNVSYKTKLYMGRSITWNQLRLDNGASGSAAVINQYQEFGSENTNIVYGHKYFVSFSARYVNGNTNTDYVWFKLGHTGYGEFTFSFNPTTDFTAYEHIGTLEAVAPTQVYQSYFMKSTEKTETLVMEWKDLQLFDLTLMFGSGNEPTTPAEFWSHFGRKYYPYNAGESQPLFKISRKRKLYMGRNIEWNQLLDKSKFRATAELNGITAKNNGDGTFTLNGTYNLTDTTWINFYVDIEDVSLSKKLYGHKILYGCVQNPSAGSQSNEWGICYEINNNMSNGAFVLGNLGESSVIVTLNKVAAPDITGNGFYFFFRAPSSGSAVYKDVVVRPQLFDLTQMFGAGNEPSTVEEFWSYFGNVVYPYNEGETQPLFKISRKSTTGSGV